MQNLQQYNITDGWLANPCVRLPCTHYNNRPNNIAISLIVIHCISLPPKHYDNNYVEDFFGGKLDCSLHPYFEQLQNVKVSSHLYIKRNGQAYQFVNFKHRAWHAGASSWNGVDECNDYSIGIELQGLDSDIFTEQQYQSLVSICQTLLQFYPAITKNRIVGHSEIAPKRKLDPGAYFDWQRVINQLS